jgi:prepilin-type N-terminal cleavage/methylation domain-containing protein
MMHRAQHGWSLLEVLVALVVLSVGLLGLSALHWRTVQHSHAIMGQTIATLHAQDAAEQLWLLPCWNSAHAQTTLEAWAQANGALPDWQATWQWHTGTDGWARLHITQTWARHARPYGLTLTTPMRACQTTP